MENSTPSLSGNWYSHQPLKTARSHPATCCYQHKIYVFGGGFNDFKSLNSVEIYDPQNDTWSKGADMPTLRSGAMAQTIDDKIYVIGGGYKQSDGNFRYLRTTEIYDPATDRWATGPDMLMPHDYPGSCVLDDYLYIFSGHDPESMRGGPKTDPGFYFCERLHIASGLWEEIAAIPTPRFALNAIPVAGKILTLGGAAFMSGGFTNFSHSEVYDPMSDSWQHSEITLPWTAAGQISCIVNGKLFVMGGYSNEGINNHAACLNLKTENTGNRAWIMLENIPVPLVAMGVVSINNSIYAIGGWTDENRIPQSSLYEFRINADSS